MKSCAFLTCRKLGGFVHDDRLADEPFARLGWRVSHVPWDDPQTDWTSFDGIVIRTTWDYTERVDEFLDALTRIEATGVPLWNRLPIVRWNARKTYLLELEKQGVPVVPTVFSPGKEGHAAALRTAFAELGTPEIIVKPVIGAGSRGILRLRGPDVPLDDRDEPLFFQPLLRAVMSEGEYSLIFFENELSHGIRKVPKAGDFRSQEEFGSAILPVAPEPELLARSAEVLETLKEPQLYSRLDWVRGNDGMLRLIELELIEPALYLRSAAGAAARFAGAFDRRMRRL